MSERVRVKQYDLEDRTFEFARRVRAFVKTLKPTIANMEDGRQLVKASGSVGANYIEANEALSKKDFRMRIKISRKEAKESRYWLRLVDTDSNTQQEQERAELVQEATELMKIFGSVLQKADDLSRRLAMFVSFGFLLLNLFRISCFNIRIFQRRPPWQPDVCFMY